MNYNIQIENVSLDNENQNIEPTTKVSDASEAKDMALRHLNQKYNSFEFCIDELKIDIGSMITSDGNPYIGQAYIKDKKGNTFMVTVTRD